MFIMEDELETCNHAIQIDKGCIHELKKALDAFIVHHFCVYRLFFINT